MTGINLEIVNSEQIRDWIWYGILHHALDSEITDEILLEFNITDKTEDDDEDKYNFANNLLARSAEIYFKLGFEVANMK